MSSSSPLFDLPSHARPHFPTLLKHPSYIYADSAGGSQCLQSAIDNITDYLVNTNVQLGASYTPSQLSTSRIHLASLATAALLNAPSPSSIIFGPSSTQLLANLAAAIDADIRDEEEIIVTGEHESNVGPWKKLAARRNLTIKTWHATPIPPSSPSSPSTPINPYALTLSPSALLPLITPHTRLIAFPATSNILGSLFPSPSSSPSSTSSSQTGTPSQSGIASLIASIRARAKELGCRKLEVVIDCVAYAPHRRIDVQEWDVDYCVFSYYKVYGPHTSTLYTRPSSLLSSLSSLNHHFLSTADLSTAPYKLQPGGAGYELVYATTAVLGYLVGVGVAGAGGSDEGLNDLKRLTELDVLDLVSPSNRPLVNHALTAAFAHIAAHEQELLRPLMAYLTSEKAWKRGVRVVGSAAVGEAGGRVPTVSFVVIGGDGGKGAMRSRDVVGFFDRRGDMGIRHGHFYAYTLVDSLRPKLDVDDGVVRISLVHYNTVEEVGRLIGVLEEALA